MSRLTNVRPVRPAPRRSDRIDALISARLDGAALQVPTAALEGVELSLSVRIAPGAVLEGSDAEVASEVIRQLAALFAAASVGPRKKYELAG